MRYNNEENKNKNLAGFLTCFYCENINSKLKVQSAKPQRKIQSWFQKVLNF